MNNSNNIGAICLAASLSLAGCAVNEPPTVAVQPVTIGASDFCQFMTRKLTWDVRDTRPTIDGIRRLNSKYVSRCSSKKRSA